MKGSLLFSQGFIQTATEVRIFHFLLEKNFLKKENL